MTIKKTTKLGGSASGITIAKTGHGLMMMTWVPTPVPDEQAFEAIKAGLDSLPPNTKMLINSGEFYGFNPRQANLELVARFFEKYPEYADKAFLSVKGGYKADSMVLDTSCENIRRTIDVILAKLRGTKRLDLFELSRMAPEEHSVEENMAVLKALVAEGKFDHVGLSEVSADTVRKANAVVPVAAVEIEVSPWSYSDEVKNVIATCKELSIPVVAYSPLGRGFLTGQVKRPADLEPGDFRLRLSRFKEDAMAHNFALVDALVGVAAKKGITPAQLAIAWVSARGPHVVPLPGSSHKTRTLENLAGGDVELTDAELAEIDAVREAHGVQGGRYVDELGDKALHLMV
ncbi:aldo/keto reductase [Dentipellis sp. KUC8613]|nr:aldo/keto reductase [Dentipellis sp. KUC8613]